MRAGLCGDQGYRTVQTVPVSGLGALLNSFAQEFGRIINVATLDKPLS
jgi:hypothetical protein